jgi:lipid A disaccharide synthetase
VLKLEIDKKSDEMIKKLEKYQEECYENIKLSNIQEIIKTAEKKITKNQEELVTWTKELNLLLNDEAKWDIIKKKADLLNSKLKDNLNELKMNFLKDEYWNF